MLSAELKAFYMVARLGSITLAAKKLGLSQPTVTTQIRNLESQYSVELFYRGGRRLSVSDEGARLLPMVKGLLQQEADIEFFLRTSGQVQGMLRIGQSGRCKRGTGDQDQVRTGGDGWDERAHRFAQKSFRAVPIDSRPHRPARRHPHLHTRLVMRLHYQHNKRVGIGLSITPHPLEVFRSGQTETSLHPRL